MDSNSVPDDIARGVEQLWQLTDLYEEIGDGEVRVYSISLRRNIAYFQRDYRQIENPLWATGCSQLQWISCNKSRRNDPSATEYAEFLRAVANDLTSEIIVKFRADHPMMWADLQRGWQLEPEIFRQAIARFTITK